LRARHKLLAAGATSDGDERPSTVAIAALASAQRMSPFGPRHLASGLDAGPQELTNLFYRDAACREGEPEGKECHTPEVAIKVNKATASRRCTPFSAAKTRAGCKD
jgi:hypothetical protein